jgi:hypothetical protein
MDGAPEPENYSEKEVYAFFGLAAYSAQVLEKGLVNMVVAFKTFGAKISRDEFDLRGQLRREARQATLQVARAHRPGLTFPQRATETQRTVPLHALTAPSIRSVRLQAPSGGPGDRIAPPTRYAGIRSRSVASAARKYAVSQHLIPAVAEGSAC